jgi:hypothetical protein
MDTKLLLVAAYSRARHDRLPLMEFYHNSHDRLYIEIEPIHLHAHVIELTHIGKKFYKEQNLPVLFSQQSRDKRKRSFNESLLTLRHWLQQLLMRKLNLDLNHNPTSESPIRYRRLLQFSLFLYPALILFFVVGPIGYIPSSFVTFYIDDRNLFSVWVPFVDGFRFFII